MAGERTGTFDPSLKETLLATGGSGAGKGLWAPRGWRERLCRHRAHPPTAEADTAGRQAPLQPMLETSEEPRRAAARPAPGQPAAKPPPQPRRPAQDGALPHGHPPRSVLRAPCQRQREEEVRGGGANLLLFRK